jgi:DNA-binding response OmpR family regulator
MPKKILIVEDYPHIVDVLKIRLEAAGYEVVAAGDGQEGLNMARSEKPDLIILDVMLPKMNGYKVCRLLKFDVKYKNIPIFLLTARAKPEDIQTGKATGANEYIIKPYDPQELLATIRRYLAPGKEAPQEQRR